MQAELMQEAMQEDQDFRKFAIIAKVTVHSKNSNFRYVCNFIYDSEIHYA